MKRREKENNHLPDGLPYNTYLVYARILQNFICDNVNTLKKKIGRSYFDRTSVYKIRFYDVRFEITAVK